MGNRASHDGKPKFEKEETVSGFSISRLSLNSVNQNTSFWKQSHGMEHEGKRARDTESWPGAKTLWPVSHTEAPFFPEFPLRCKVNEQGFHVIKVLSKGAYGKVFQVKHKDTGNTYAMKVIQKSLIFEENFVTQVKTEVQIQKLCGHHTFLIPGSFNWQNRKNLFMVTQFISGGDLHNLWEQTGSFDEDLIKLYIGETAIVLDFLHNAGIIYRDLKMENILIDSDGHLKLTDFGLSKWLSIGNKTCTMCGTIRYMAPEIFQKEPYTHAIDWWSLGILLYALLRGEFPFKSLPDERGGEDEEPAGLMASDEANAPSVHAQRLVQSLLHRDPKRRLRSLRNLQQHAFYHHFDFDALRAKEMDPLPMLTHQRTKRRVVPSTVSLDEVFE